jgi:hypothetical protein
MAFSSSMFVTMQVQASVTLPKSPGVNGKSSGADHTPPGSSRSSTMGSGGFKRSIQGSSIARCLGAAPWPSRMSRVIGSSGSKTVDEGDNIRGYEERHAAHYPHMVRLIFAPSCGIQIDGDNTRLGSRLRVCMGPLGNGPLRPICVDMALRIDDNNLLQRNGASQLPVGEIG